MVYLDVYIEEQFMGNVPLTYHSNGFDVQAGIRVWVSLQNRHIIGFVKRVYDPVEKPFEVLGIQGVVDQEAIVNDELNALAEWMSYRNVAPIIRCYQTLLPNKLRPRRTAKEAKKHFVLLLNPNRLEHKDLTVKQVQFLECFDTNPVMTLTQARKVYSGFQKLVDKGIVLKKEQEVAYQENRVHQTYPKPKLTEIQEKIVKDITQNNHDTHLVFGVTGSGKTEVYLHVAQQCIDQGQQVLILVPEISLTPQMIDRVSRRFGQDVAIYHSALNDQEKYEQYMRVKNGTVQIVVGTRSAVFMPFQNLGCIIMDEEHDSSYKQELTPYYHTRDVARWRADYHHCPLILGSASPSLETYARALRGVYRLHEMTDRINHNFPKVSVVDTNKTLMNRQSAYLTPELCDAISERLLLKQQVILLLNRRGYHTLMKDQQGNVLECPHCDVALNYHKDDQKLHCHTCGYQQTSQSKQSLVGSGVGTQRLEEAVQNLFPQAKILRMDADTTQRKNAHQKILQSFENHEADILIGTQMIAKGLDIEKVTLVGLINADTALMHTDFRSVELTFNMLLQATGRAGRGRYPGEVLIQTADPNHYAVQCAIHQKYKHFFQLEMRYRKIAKYPPYEYLISISIQNEQEALAHSQAETIAAAFRNLGIHVIGPSQLRKINRKYRNRILLKGKDLDLLIRQTHQVFDHLPSKNRRGVVVDVNPLTIES